MYHLEIRGKIGRVHNVPVSTRCLGVIVTSRPWISKQQLSLRRAVHGTDTEMLPINPSMISTGMPALSNISFTD